MSFKHSVLVALTVIASGCTRPEESETVFSDMQAARDAGAMERGWIPQFASTDATKVRLRHDLDTNEVWLQYFFPIGKGAFTIGSCQPIDGAHVVKPRERAGRWWPSELTQKTPNEENLSFSYYRCLDGGFIAIDQQDGLAYFWRAAS